MYTHSLRGDPDVDLPTGKVVCVGRNYADHIEELDNPIPKAPLLFIKPAEAIVDMHSPILIPCDKGECHNELEVALLLNKRLSRCTKEEAIAAICGIGLGLDLTLRNLQDKLRRDGHPWERAKAFDGSCPLSEFIPVAEFENLQSIQFSLSINQQVRQSGSTAMMLFNIGELLVEISQSFTLSPGDVVLTGTPKGVGKLNDGDVLFGQLGDKIELITQIAGAN